MGKPEKRRAKFILREHMWTQQRKQHALCLESSLVKKKREEKKNLGREISPYINLGIGDTLAQKSRESSPGPKTKLQNMKLKCGSGGLLEAPGSRTWL
eukprot:1140087-Pelagomonas_calceolata.AAC.1